MSCNIVKQDMKIYEIYRNAKEFLCFLGGCGSTLSNSTSKRAFEQVLPKDPGVAYPMPASFAAALLAGTPDARL